MCSAGCDSRHIFYQKRMTHQLLSGVTDNSLARYEIQRKAEVVRMLENGGRACRQWASRKRVLRRRSIFLGISNSLLETAS